MSAFAGRWDERARSSWGTAAGAARGGRARTRSPRSSRRGRRGRGAIELDVRTCGRGRSSCCTIAPRAPLAELRAQGADAGRGARLGGERDVAVNVELKHDVPSRAARSRAPPDASSARRADVLLSSFDPRSSWPLRASRRALPRALPHVARHSARRVPHGARDAPSSRRSTSSARRPTPRASRATSARAAGRRVDGQRPARGRRPRRARRRRSSPTGRGAVLARSRSHSAGHRLDAHSRRRRAASKVPSGSGGFQVDLRRR